MKSILKLIAIGAIFALSSAFTPFDKASFADFASLVGTPTTWVNEKNSTMTISVQVDGTVTGQYINRASGTGCQNTPYPIAGRVNGNFIAFSVGWVNGTQDCHSATAWSGFAQQSGSELQIQTQWNLAYQGGSGPQFMQGSDVFTYQPSTMMSFIAE